MSEKQYFFDAGEKRRRSWVAELKQLGITHTFHGEPIEKATYSEALSLLSIERAKQS
ncbi:hypothetical protein [Indiicoccus explosivorum]|uniref:hypothetical protein n=1 Tax=Indiicoccus explosivorum TaxID=1917864 RepID=UPI0012D771D0|nr:hypothetical protein [Indiicoccus explosivorum]